MSLSAKDSYPIYLFHEGTNYEAQKLMSPRRTVVDGKEGWLFRVYAPNAVNVCVVGDFNSWTVGKHPMKQYPDGIWSLFIPGLKEYDNYKYAVTGRNKKTVLKCDPYGLHFETPPANSSKLYDIEGYNWKDKKWMQARCCYDPYGSPMNIYEVHLGSWRKYPDGNFYDYSAIADELIPYVKKMGYTHIELMPLTEYPFDGSWGYQVTGMFAPTSRYGTPKALMSFIDKCHRAGIGVILDWVLAHFPRDEHGLANFDGTPLYEYADPRKGEHKEWGTKVYDFGKNEVKCFLISAAMFWFDTYHIDGIRCDAVASMLYLDYGREKGEWTPNAFGGNYNLEAKDFLKAMNTAILSKHRGALTIAEESTAFPMVTKPAYDGGLGFNFKWNMGWMNDSLHYLSLDPFFRKDNHNDLTFSITYAYSENYILPLSHDEVVHGKRSMIDKIPREYDDKFEELKTFYGYMMAHPGKKLNFMGNEFAQFIEWNYTKELDWLLLDYPRHKEMQKYVRDLNNFYLENKAFWQLDCSYEGFKWIVIDDNRQNIVAFMRRAADGEYVICVMNFSPVERPKYIMGVPEQRIYRAEFISSLKKYGGDEARRPVFRATAKPSHGFQYSIKINVPKNTVMYIKPVYEEGDYELE
jgi:1,4-alpha-glucan branching enzyme